MKLRFLGYGNIQPFYGEGSFTVGQYYTVKQVKSYKPHQASDALFVDDRGGEFFEDLTFFADDN